MPNVLNARDLIFRSASEKQVARPGLIGTGLVAYISNAYRACPGVRWIHVMQKR